MLQRRFTLSLMALVSLLLLGFGRPAEADYGVESNQPLSDPNQASVDDRPVGTWRAVIRDKTYFLHVGTGNIVGKSNWMELVLVSPGEKPTFYVHHKIGFHTKIDDMNFFNITNMSVPIPELRGSKTENLISSVQRYDILKYEIDGDQMVVWAADHKFVRKAIEAGEIKGKDATIDDTAENLIRFIKASGPKLYTRKVEYTRVK